MRINFLVVIMVVLSMFNSVKAEQLKIGDIAPNFKLYDQSGEIHSKEDYQGKWLVLYFYPKDNTPGCIKEACSFRDEYRVFTEQNAQVLGVSIDSQESHAEFAEKYQLPFPLLADVGGVVAKSYQALFSLGPFKFAKRHSFIIDPNGVVRQIYRSVNAARHGEQIIADLQVNKLKYADDIQSAN